MSLYRECSQCGESLYIDDFSRNQWIKGSGISKCIGCVSLTQQPVECEICESWFSSQNALFQHMQTHPVCEHCDEQFNSRITLNEHLENDHNICDVCDRDFTSPHALYQHSKSHVPRSIPCPICGDRKFKTAANAVAHVESGYCPGCMGKEYSRLQVYQFVSQNAPGLRVPMIENGYDENSVPDRPYRCTICHKMFTTLSAQMQHEGDAHGREPHLQQIGW